MRRGLVALALVPILVASACGSSSKKSSTAGASCPVSALTKATSPVQITFWHGMTANNETTLKKLTDDYNASQSKVHVNLVYQGSYDEISDKYLTALRGGKLPNLVMLEETRIQTMIDSQSMLPAQSCVDADKYSMSDFIPAVTAEYSVGKTLWPMPFHASEPVLFYNKLTFQKAGLDPEKPPSTYDEVLADAKAIKDSGATKSGFALTLRPGNLEEWFAKAGKQIVDNDNGRTGRATKAQLNNATGVEALTFMQKLMQQGLAVNVGSNVNEADNLLALGAGDAGMTIGTSAAIGTIYAVKDAGQYKNVEVGIAPMPGPSASSGGVVVSGSALWIVDKDKPDLEKAATWDYLKFLDKPSSQVTWHIGSGYTPIRKSVIDDATVQDLWKRRPGYRVAYDEMLASKFGKGPIIGPYKEYRDAIVQALEQVVLKGTAPATALSDAEKTANDALKSYNDRVGG